MGKLVLFLALALMSITESAKAVECTDNLKSSLRVDTALLLPLAVGKTVPVSISLNTLGTITNIDLSCNLVYSPYGENYECGDYANYAHTGLGFQVNANKELSSVSVLFASYSAYGHETFRYNLTCGK
jgi:hypothetical protein